MVASYNGGSLYWWQWTTGPNARAALVTNAPASIERILVNADTEFLIAIGASDAITGNDDPMNVRWCSEGDLTDWIAVELPVPNTAGGQRLNFGSRMVTGLQSRQQNLLWSDTQLYQMQFLANTDVFGFSELGKCYIVGPNAAVDVNGVVYMMCFDNFMIYDGTLRILPCDMWETVFGVQTQGQGTPILVEPTLQDLLADSGQPILSSTPSYTGGFDRGQAEAVYAASYMTKSEVTWFYPEATDDVIKYVTYNYEDNTWYGGTMPRTCYRDVSPALSGYVEYPYGFNNGVFYQHEIGYDEVEPNGVKNPMYYFMQSWDIGQQTDVPMIVNSIVPNWQRLRNGIQYSLIAREYPLDPTPKTFGPFILTPKITRHDPRAGGSQLSLLIEAASVQGTIVLGQDFRMGAWQSLATPHGKRLGTPVTTDAINTSNP